MKLIVNGTTTDVPDDATVASVVALLAPSSDGIAVAVNDSVVPRTFWPATALHAGDRVEVLNAVQGG